MHETFIISVSVCFLKTRIAVNVQGSEMKDKYRELCGVLKAFHFHANFMFLFIPFSLFFSPIPDMSGSVILNAYHRSFLGLDDFLGHVAIPLNQFQIYERPRSRYVMLCCY